MKELTTDLYWSELKRKAPIKGKRTSDMEFREILFKHLEINKGTALEVGCVPGTFLAYICKNFGYFPEGINFDKDTRKITSKTLLDYGLDKFKIYVGDFNKWKPKKKYDLVCSFGFVEHFDNPKEIIKKHVDLLKKGGKLIIEIPNFGGLNGFLHKLVDKENLDRHNTQIMNLDFFKEVVEQNNLNINYLGYYGSWHFQWGNRNPNIFQYVLYAGLKSISKLTIHFKMRNKLSNYIVFIAEKK